VKFRLSLSVYFELIALIISKMKHKKDVLFDKSFNFSLRVVNLYKFLASEKKEYIMSKQIIRSGTSIGANIREAKGGISKADFSAKIAISYKESLETQYWLELLFKSDFIDEKLFNSLFVDCEELSKILYATLKTTRFKN